MLYSIGKDSAVMLHLAKKAFYPSRPPFPLLHVDTTWKFRDMYALRDRAAHEAGMELLVYQNPEALEKGIMTDVVLLLDINAEGKVDSVGLVEPANPPGMGFDEAAMVAAQQFEFEPAEMDGQKIAVQITYKYKFRFKPKPGAAASPDGGVPEGGAADAGVPTPDAPAAVPA